MHHAFHMFRSKIQVMYRIREINTACFQSRFSITIHSKDNGLHSLNNKISAILLTSVSTQPRFSNNNHLSVVTHSDRASKSLSFSGDAQLHGLSNNHLSVAKCSRMSSTIYFSAAKIDKNTACLQ